jgi:hypothetical protein
LPRKVARPTLDRRWIIAAALRRRILFQQAPFNSQRRFS